MIRKRLQLTLADLIEEAEELTRRLRDLQERHLPDLEVVTDNNRPIRFPLELNWRPYGNEPMPSQVAAEVIGWIHKHLDVHIENLTRYFVDWKEQPDRLDRFPLLTVCFKPAGKSNQQFPPLSAAHWSSAALQLSRTHLSFS